MMKTIFLEFKDIPFGRIYLEITEKNAKFSELPFNEKNLVHPIKTFGEFKSMILKYFNNEQIESKHDDVEKIKFQIRDKILDKKDSDLIMDCFSNYTTCTIINENIYSRLISEPKFKHVISYALFEYHEFDETKYKECVARGRPFSNPCRKTSKIIVFTIIAKVKGKYVSIMLSEPTILNFGRGSTIPSLYYRLNYNNTINIYYDEFGDDDLIRKKVSNKTCNLHALLYDEKWSSDVECNV